MPHSAFLRAIIDSPDDDLPRLVFADYLDETGDSARAEFIRVQCELATLAEHDPKYRELEDREHELLGANERLWLPDREGLSEWAWRRGFVDDVTVQNLSRDATDALFDLQPITRWSARQGYVPPHLSDAAISRIRHLDSTGMVKRKNRLIERCFGQRQFSSYQDSDVGSISYFSSLLSELQTPHSLTELRLNDFAEISNSLRYSVSPASYGAELSRALGKGRLEHLSLTSCNLTTRDVDQILQSPSCRELRELNIADNPIGPDAYRAFEKGNTAMRLQSLDVSGTSLAGISLEPLLNARALESLTKLEINGCGSARRNMEVLAGSKFWTQATQLRAHSGTIPASTLEPLCHSDGPKELRLLDLADNYLRTVGVRLLCDAPWAESLAWLALSGNLLDDDSCRVLAECGRLRSLRTLHLASNNIRQEYGDGEEITDAGARALAHSEGLANLRLLTLSQTGITHRGMIAVLEGSHWRLTGLGVAGCGLNFPATHILAGSPRLGRLNWLDLSGNPDLGGRVLLPLAESPYLSPLLELDCGGIDIAPEVQAIFRERLGPRFTY